MAGLTIGKFAEAAGVGVETVRFYQRRGVFAGGEVVKQLVGARSKSAMLREMADFL